MDIDIGDILLAGTLGATGYKVLKELTPASRTMFSKENLSTLGTQLSRGTIQKRSVQQQSVLMHEAVERGRWDVSVYLKNTMGHLREPGEEVAQNSLRRLHNLALGLEGTRSDILDGPLDILSSPRSTSSQMAEAMMEMSLQNPTYAHSLHSQGARLGNIASAEAQAVLETVPLDPTALNSWDAAASRFRPIDRVRIGQFEATASVGTPGTRIPGQSLLKQWNELSPTTVAEIYQQHRAPGTSGIIDSAKQLVQHDPNALSLGVDRRSGLTHLEMPISITSYKSSQNINMRIPLINREGLTTVNGPLYTTMQSAFERDGMRISSLQQTTLDWLYSSNRWDASTGKLDLLGLSERTQDRMVNIFSDFEKYITEAGTFQGHIGGPGRSMLGVPQVNRQVSRLTEMLPKELWSKEEITAYEDLFDTTIFKTEGVSSVVAGDPLKTTSPGQLYGPSQQENIIDKIFAGGPHSRTQFVRAETATRLASGKNLPLGALGYLGHSEALSMMTESGHLLPSMRLMGSSPELMRMAAADLGMSLLSSSPLGTELQILRGSTSSQYRAVTQKTTNFLLNSPTSGAPNALADALLRDIQGSPLEAELRGIVSIGDNLDEHALIQILQDPGGIEAISRATQKNYLTNVNALVGNPKGILGTLAKTNMIAGSEVLADDLLGGTTRQLTGFGIQFKKSSQRRGAHDILLQVHEEAESTINKWYRGDILKGLQGDVFEDTEMDLLGKRLIGYQELLSTTGLSADDMSDPVAVSAHIKNKWGDVSQFSQAVTTHINANSQRIAAEAARIDMFTSEAFKHLKGRAISPAIGVMANEPVLQLMGSSEFAGSKAGQQFRQSIQELGFAPLQATEQTLYEAGVSGKNISRIRGSQGRYRQFWGLGEATGPTDLILPGIHHGGTDFPTSMAEADIGLRNATRQLSHNMARENIDFVPGLHWGESSAHGMFSIQVAAGQPAYFLGHGKTAALRSESYNFIKQVLGDDIAGGVLRRAMGGSAGREVEEIANLVHTYHSKAANTLEGVRYIDPEDVVGNAADFLRALDNSTDTYQALAGQLGLENVPKNFVFRGPGGEHLYIPKSIPFTGQDTSFLGNRAFYGTSQKGTASLTRYIENILKSDPDGITQAKQMFERTAADMATAVTHGRLDFINPAAGGRYMTISQGESINQEILTYARKGLTQEAERRGIKTGELMQHLVPVDAETMARARRFQGADASEFVDAAFVRPPGVDPGRGGLGILYDPAELLEASPWTGAGQPFEIEGKRAALLKRIKTRLAPGQMHLPEAMIKILGADFDQDPLQMFFVAAGRDEQDIMRDFYRKGHADVWHTAMTDFAQLAEFKKQKMIDFTTSALGNAPWTGSSQQMEALAEVSKSYRTAGSSVARTYNTVLPALAALSGEGTASSVAARSMLFNIEESAAITLTKRENFSEIEKALDSFLSASGSGGQGRVTDPKRMQVIIQDLLKTQGMDAEHFASKNNKTTFEEATADMARALTGSSEKSRRAKAVLAMKSRGTAPSQIIDTFAKMLDPKQYGSLGHFQADVVGRVGGQAVHELSGAKRGFYNAKNLATNAMDMLSASPGAKKSLKYGLPIALGASLLFSRPSRLDIDEDEIQAAMDAAREQGFNPQHPADFRQASRPNISVPSGLRATIEGVVPNVDAANLSAQLQSAMPGANTHIRVSDHRMDLTAARIREMSESGRSY